MLKNNPLVENPDIFAQKYRVSSPRLHNWDYSSPAIYFVTICVFNHNKLLGQIIDNKIILSPVGKIVAACLDQIPLHFSFAQIDTSVIMPNHLHLLLNLRSKFVETRDRASLPKEYQSYHFHRLANKSNQRLPLIINQFKSSIKRQCHHQNLFFAWQPRYFFTN